MVEYQYNCNLCNKNECLFTGIRKAKYKLLRCENCNLLFIYPTPSSSDLKKFYNSYLTQKGFKYLNTELNNYKLRTYWKKRLDLISKFEPRHKSKNFLDVGTGSGEWLEILNRNNVKQYTGLEISKDEYRILAKKYKNNIKNTSLDKFKNKNKFDVVTLWDVLEHFTDLNKSLKKIKSVTINNGLILISTVNTDSLSFMIRKASWRYFCPPEHTFYFNEKCIDYIANKFNFELLYYGTKLELQGFTMNSDVIGNTKKININFYKTKNFIENNINFLLRGRGEIITIVFRNKD